LPSLLARPIHTVPVGLRNAALATVLNALFRTDIDSARLDFLRDHALGVRVEDAGLAFQLRLEGNHLRVARGIEGVAVTIRGSVYDFLLLAARREDADTLFFQRRLRVQGNTELGLEVKNFLDSVDLEALPFYGPLDALLQRGIPLYERLFTRRV
jgi:predicted lipid carrier protein YhbT